MADLISLLDDKDDDEPAAEAAAAAAPSSFGAASSGVNDPDRLRTAPYPPPRVRTERNYDLKGPKVTLTSAITAMCLMRGCSSEDCSVSFLWFSKNALALVFFSFFTF